MERKRFILIECCHAFENDSAGSRLVPLNQNPSFHWVGSFQVEQPLS
jgi:hypothetical protein